MNRAHELVKSQCSRCCTIFDNERTLYAHTRLEESCQLNSGKDAHVLEGVSKDQRLKLQSRKGKRKGLSEGDKWIEMYKILFPKETVIPSPCKSQIAPMLLAGL